MNDISEIVRHHEAFWECSHVDRCCLYLKVKSDEPKHNSVEQKWEDMDFRLMREKYIALHTQFFADAVPDVFINFGPGNLAEFVGGSFRWAEDTVWFDRTQLIEDFENPPDLKLNKNSTVFKLAERFTELMLGCENIFPSVPDIGGILDTVAALRGSQNLLYDLYDYPEEVLAMSRKIQEMWYEAFEHFSNMIMDKKGILTSWIPILSKKPYYPMQCDFAAMISPDMFKEFVMPELEFQTSKMPRSVYHLDGVGEIPHLEHLLKLEGLNAIQWTPGVGEEHANAADEYWFDMYRQIQKAGKGVILLDANPELVENAVKKLSPDGLFIQANCSDEAQAAEIIECAIKR